MRMCHTRLLLIAFLAFRDSKGSGSCAEILETGGRMQTLSISVVIPLLCVISIAGGCAVSGWVLEGYGFDAGRCPVAGGYYDLLQFLPVGGRRRLITIQSVGIPSH
jgi:hypothetical protein